MLKNKESLTPDSELMPRINHAVSGVFSDLLRNSLRHPRLAVALWRMARAQKRAARVRSEHAKAGLHVPPYMIISVTNRCNLHCVGCYAQASHRPEAEEMCPDRLEEILTEAQSLGVSVVLLAGGEPLMRQEILDVAASFPKLAFPVFTNGLLLDENHARFFSRHRHIVPIISLEGHANATDNRRGKGVFAHVAEKIRLLKRFGILFGGSFTVTSQNLPELTDNSFINELLTIGMKMFFFIEYVPIAPGTDELTITTTQRTQLHHFTDSFRQKYPALFVAFPGDEEEFGGCLAAGRGFIHVSPAGRVEPCPFAPFSDSNLSDISLEDALHSDFLAAIRQNHEMLSETRGGCALWNNREWVASLLSAK